MSKSFGIGLVGTSSGNVIERNIIGGNTNGIWIAAKASGNIVRLNNVSGNPATQILLTFGSAVGTDIHDLSPAGSNTFEDNLCATSSSAGPAPCPNIPDLFFLLLKRFVGP